MAETIAIGERAGLAPVITHMKLQGHEQGQADAIIEGCGRPPRAASIRRRLSIRISPARPRSSR